jgi:hypothetical protein
LNNLRNNQITAADVQALNKYVKPDFDLKNTKAISPDDSQCKSGCYERTRRFKGELITYKPDIVGDFPEKIFPIEERLKLNSGAGHVREKMICQWTRIISTENGSHKISFESGNLVHFPEEDKTIEVEK